MISKIVSVYFSPTGGTQKIATEIAKALASSLDMSIEELDLTSCGAREGTYEFGQDTLVVAAMPTYAGRLPNKIAPDLAHCLKGSGTKALAVTTFGNRSPGDSLNELVKILQSDGFDVIGGASFVCRHAFTDEVGKGRPTAEDLAQMKTWALEALQRGESLPSLTEYEPLPYYIPLKETGAPAKFLKAKALTDAVKCTACGICAASCPVGSIKIADSSAITEGICIKCQACIRKCPSGARFIEDEDFLSHVRMLMRDYA